MSGDKTSIVGSAKEPLLACVRTKGESGFFRWSDNSSFQHGALLVFSHLKMTTTALAFISLAFCYSLVAQADCFGSGANTFEIEFVTIGNPGNAADTDDGSRRTGR